MYADQSEIIIISILHAKNDNIWEKINKSRNIN